MKVSINDILEWSLLLFAEIVEENIPCNIVLYYILPSPWLDTNCSWNSSRLSLSSQTQIGIQCFALSVNTEVQRVKVHRASLTLKVIRTRSNSYRGHSYEKKNCPLENPGIGREKRCERTYTYRCAVELNILLGQVLGPSVGIYLLPRVVLSLRRLSRGVRQVDVADSSGYQP